MSQTDPIAELLTRIRNAMHARYNQVELPHSRVREAICRVLLAEGFLAGIETPGEGYKKKLMLGLRYSPHAGAGYSRACSASASPACGATPGPKRCRELRARWVCMWSRRRSA